MEVLTMHTALSFTFLFFLLISAYSDLNESYDEDAEVSITTTNTDQVYKRGDLIFSDEFDSFDLEIWNHEITFGGNALWEFQMYVNSRENSYAKDGYLYIRPTLTSDRYGSDFVYNGHLTLEGSIPVEECTSTALWGCYRSGNYPDVLNPVMSAKIRTVNSFYFKYGRVDIRAKLPSADWTTTAINLMPRFNAYGEWPASGQIEILTSRGNKKLHLHGDKMGSDVVMSKIHFGPDFKRNGQECTHTSFEAPPDEGFDTDFHVYSVEWTDEQITFLVDNMTVRVISPSDGGFWHYGCFDNHGIENPWTAGENKRMAPYDQKVAIGSVANGLISTTEVAVSRFEIYTVAYDQVAIDRVTFHLGGIWWGGSAPKTQINIKVAVPIYLHGEKFRRNWIRNAKRMHGNTYMTFYIILNVAAGGTNIGIWPDGITSGNNKKKPWSNSQSAFLDFYEAMNDWYPSWEGDSGALIVDYIRVYAV